MSSGPFVPANTMPMAFLVGDLAKSCAGIDRTVPGLASNPESFTQAANESGCFFVHLSTSSRVSGVIGTVLASVRAAKQSAMRILLAERLSCAMITANAGQLKGEKP